MIKMKLTEMVWYRDFPNWALNSDLIFLRSTSQREIMILVTTFSFAPLLCNTHSCLTIDNIT